MDNFKVIYKILKLLEAAMDYDEFDRSQLIPEYFGISENRLDALLVMLQAEGYMALDNNSSNELVVTIKTGDDQYYKDYIYLNDWTCYVMEQTEPKGTDKYHYELVFYPERLIPDIEIK